MDKHYKIQKLDLILGMDAGKSVMTDFSDVCINSRWGNFSSHDLIFNLKKPGDSLIFEYPPDKGYLVTTLIFRVHTYHKSWCNLFVTKLDLNKQIKEHRLTQLILEKTMKIQ